MNPAYLNLLRLPGAAAFSAAAFLGRMPAGMMAFAILLPVSALTGSYTIAGFVAASAMLGMALAAPVGGRMVDRYGQRPVLLTYAALNCIGTATLMISIRGGAPLGDVCLAAALTGASRLSTGTLARTRWAHVTRTLDPLQRAGTLQAAYAFEAVIDELVFISAPVLVTWLCTAVHPLAGLACCLACFVVGAVALAGMPGTQPAPMTLRIKRHSAFAVPGVKVMAMAVLLIGVGAGAIEMIVVARADAAGARSLAGWLMAGLALSSMLAGFWYGARAFMLAAHRLWVRCVGLLAAALVLLMLAGNLPVLALALGLTGLMIAPTSIAGQILAERLAPPGALNEAMSLIATAMTLGMAAGGWLAGMLTDRIGVYGAGVLPAAATAMALLIAMARAHTLIEPAARHGIR